MKSKDKTVWGWADKKAGMPTVDEQIEALENFKHEGIKCEEVYSPPDNTIDHAVEHGLGRPHGDTMVVVGLRILHGKHARVMKALAVHGHNLFSIATNRLYDCNNAATFDAANSEYNAQKIAPANKAIEGAPGPKRILTKKHIKAAQLMRDSGKISLEGISKRLLEEHEVSVSASTLSRRLSQ